MSRNFQLPSGKLVTRFFSHGQLLWQLPALGQEDWVTLGRADVRALAELAGFEVDDPADDAAEGEPE